MTHTGCLKPEGLTCVICDRRDGGRLSDEAWAAIGGTPSTKPTTILPGLDTANCARRGVTLRTVDCPSCGGNKVKAKVSACSTHVECTQFTKPIPGVRACKGCPDYLPPSVDLLPGLPDPIPHAETVPYAKGKVSWAKQPPVRARHIEAFRSLLGMGFPPAEKAEGDGVILCGGGDYWPLVVVSIRMLRRVSSLPVQVWHRPDEKVNPEDLAGIDGVTIHDASKVSPSPRILRKWEIKTIALLHCGFRRALYLDADAYAVADPSPFLSLASERRFVYWSDFPNQATSIAWGHFGVSPSSGNPVPPVQGGQLAIDLVAFRRELVLSHWLNQHSDYAYHFGYGDQDMYRVSLVATGGTFLHLGRADWELPAFVCRLDDKPIVVHRCQGKMGIDAAGPCPTLPREATVWEYYEDTQRQRTEAEKVFGRIYQGGLWGPPGDSGAGSTYAESQPYVEAVAKLAERHGWKSCVDLGSGDGRVARRLPFDRIIGVECHLPHVERLKAGCADIDWRHLDIVNDREQLPTADVALVRDVLHHWPTAMVKDFVGWLKTCGKYRWVVLCYDHGAAGGDCPLGGYRALSHDAGPLAGHGLTLVGRYLHKEISLMECDHG